MTDRPPSEGEDPGAGSLVPRSRRSILAAAGALATAGLAGCSGDGNGSTPTATATDTPTPTATTTPTPTPTGTPTTATGTPTRATTSRTTTTTGGLSEERRRATAREFVRTLASEAYSAAADRFAPDLGVDPSALETVWVALRRQDGPFVGIEGTDLRTVQGYDGVVVRTRFSRGLRRLLVLLDDRGRLVGFRILDPAGGGEWSPPEYVDAGAIETTAVTVDGPGSCSLPGEVTVPASVADEGTPSIPSFVLVGGSGPTDLDGTVGPNKPYRDLTYGLASAGEASSLRYTKRTGACRADPASLTIDDEYTDDAVAAVERLRASDGADPERTVVVGHSLGGYLAPRVADRVDGVAGVVVLAPPGRPLHEAILDQTRYLAELDGEVTDAERERIDEVAAAVERIETQEIGANETVLGGGRAYWRSLLGYDPVATIEAFDGPVLALFGGRDYQVTEADREVWRDALAGRSNATVRTYDSLNHLFVPGSGPATPEEYSEPGHVDPQVVADLGDWLAARWQG